MCGRQRKRERVRYRDLKRERERERETKYWQDKIKMDRQKVIVFVLCYVLTVLIIPSKKSVIRCTGATRLPIGENEREGEGEEGEGE